MLATEQTKASSTGPDLSDPIDAYTEFRIAATAAQQNATLHAENLTVVEQKFAAMQTAQRGYVESKAAQSAAYAELIARLAALRKPMECLLEQGERTQLTTCWEKVSGHTTSTGAAPSSTVCAETDALDPAQALPTDIGRLTTLITSATACVAWTDAEMDRLTAVPADLAGRITGLSDRVVALEQGGGGTAAANRSFVEYLQLRYEVEQLAALWVDQEVFGRTLGSAFTELVARHRTLIRLMVALAEWQRRRELADEAARTREANLVELVLQCVPSAPASVAAGAQQSPTQQSPTQQSPAQQSPAQSGPQGTATPPATS